MRRIVYGLDVYSFIARLDQTGSDVPLYLYDDSLLNDVSYWLNRSVLATFLPRCLSAWGQKQDDSIRDSMYCWAGQDEYGSVALYTARFTAPENPLPADAYIRQAQANLDAHLLPYVAAHPETQFDIFFPPYSAAEWATMESKGTLESMLALRSLCYDALSGFANVTIYDFTTRADWVLDLNNYKDALHYGQWINDAITECIARGENVVDRETLDAATAQFRAWPTRRLGGDAPKGETAPIHQAGWRLDILTAGDPAQLCPSPSRLSPPSPPPKFAKRQALAHAGDLAQFPICQKQAEPLTSAEVRETSGSRSRGRSHAISNVPNRRQPYGRLLAASGILLAVVLVSALMTTFKQAPNLDALADATAVPSVEPTPSPEPTITPTPAVYAPFGAQYGYGGANLIPDTPTPDPVTPMPTAAPTDPPAPTAVPTRTLKKNSTGETLKSSSRR